MKCRAKPKYVISSDIEEVLRLPSLPNKDREHDFFYFNSGRNALTFILRFLNVKTVGIQSFNCLAVLDAVKRARCKTVLLDIKLSDFSIGLDDLKTSEGKIDVLILTHYQGIPNIDYVEIINYCREKEIIVIEDLAQTIGASVDNIEVGTLGDYCIYSFAIDKPFTCFEGGALKVNKLDLELIDKYEELGFESVKKALTDLEKVKFYDVYYQEDNYFEGLENKRSLWCFLIKYLNKKTTYKILKMNFISSVLVRMVNFFVKNNSDDPILKLDENKMKLVLLQKEKFKNSEQQKVSDIVVKYGIILNEEISKKNVKICWNRLSVLDEFGEIEKAIKVDQIDCGNYNWPIPLHLLDSFDEKEKYKNCEKSELAAKSILNIPCW